MSAHEPAAEAQRFQVDLGGVISLLSQNLYSSPGVFVRELLQNAVDAVAARRLLGGDQPSSPTIVISPFGEKSPGSPASELSITDPGIGVSLEQVDQFLATVGGSTKRSDIDAGRRDFLGQFGIGLLSCFLVADEIEVVSQSAAGGPAIRWTGSADGTYRTSVLADRIDVGTTVRLRPRPESVGWMRAEQVLPLAQKYGEFLPVPVVVLGPAGRKLVTRSWSLATGASSQDEIRSGAAAPMYGGVSRGRQFDVIPVDLPDASGAVYISDISRGTRRVHPNRVYVKGMLVSDADHSMLPDWAFFAWVVIDSSNLRPTASRESLVEDAVFERVRDGLGRAIESWLLDLSDTDPVRLRLFVAAHLQALKEVASATLDLGSVIIPELDMETTAGPMRIADIVANSPVVLYTDSVDAFRRIAAFAPPGRLIVNAGYVHDVRVIETLPSLYPGVSLTYVDPATEAAGLALPRVADSGTVAEFEARATAALSDQAVRVTVKVFPDAALTAAFLDAGDDRWQIDATETTGLVLNWGSKVIRKLARTTDDAVFSRVIQLLYVQARMAGQYDGQSDRELLAQALSDLIALAIGADGEEPV